MPESLARGMITGEELRTHQGHAIARDRGRKITNPSGAAVPGRHLNGSAHRIPALITSQDATGCRLTTRIRETRRLGRQPGGSRPNSSDLLAPRVPWSLVGGAGAAAERRAATVPKRRSENTGPWIENRNKKDEEELEIPKETLSTRAEDGSLSRAHLVAAKDSRGLDAARRILLAD
ncbi:hypothetical protein JHW43_004476 [Diplocarpon mali]|nr:hypothetical protein JHW43_004476 [Diplocarpon mali]